MKPFMPCFSITSMRAASTGSSGGANGSLSMITSESASPRTSTPSQKLWLPTSTALPALRNESSSSVRPALALHEQRELEAAVGKFLAQALGHVLDGAVGGAQEEGAPAGRFDHRQGAVDDRVGVAHRVRIGQPGRHVQQSLLLVVERTRPGLRRLAGQSHLLGEMLEVVFDRQRGRGENPAARRAFALIVEDRRDRQRRLVQLQRRGNASTHSTASSPSTSLPLPSAFQPSSACASSTARTRHCSMVSARAACSSSTLIMPPAVP